MKSIKNTVIKKIMHTIPEHFLKYMNFGGFFLTPSISTFKFSDCILSLSSLFSFSTSIFLSKNGNASVC